VAANVDLVLILTAADRDLNPRRIERFLAAAFDSGAEPALVLTKLDLAADPGALLRLGSALAPGVRVLGLSNLTGEGVRAVRELIRPGRTAALLGSSGVGKSSLVNRLLGHERQAVADIGADQRGRHTTTARELILLSGGGLVLDTPGMRLITPADEAGVGAAFADIEAFAAACRFKDCRHQGEPGCAVQAAVEAGVLAADRLAGHAKLRRELEHLERKDDKRAESEQRKRWRSVHKAGRERMREKRRGWD
jgi:ribosome biogenesis GTPase